MTDQQQQQTRIQTVQQLKELSQNGLDCFIRLTGGVRSSKHIRYDPDTKRFTVLNWIDDSQQELTEGQILDTEYSNIGLAMKKGSLIMD